MISLWLNRHQVQGFGQRSPLIDGRHRSMMPWKVEKRRAYLGEHGLLEEGLFWKLAQARLKLCRET
jgi:hypothetical protein